MSVPESDLAWQGVYDYAFNSLALTENDAKPGEPVDIRDLFVQKLTDVAKVEMRQYHIGGGLFHERLEWQDPIDDRRVPGLDSLIRWLNERTPGSGPTYNVRRTYHLQSLMETNLYLSKKGPMGHTRRAGGEGGEGRRG